MMKRKSTTRKTSNPKTNPELTEGSCPGPVSPEQLSESSALQTIQVHSPISPLAAGNHAMPAGGTPAMASLSGPLNLLDQFSLAEFQELINKFPCATLADPPAPARKQPANPSPGAGSTTSSPALPWPESNYFKCTDRLHLEGNLRTTGLRTLTINDTTVLKLDRRQFLTLLVLFCQGLSLAGKEVPVPVPRVPYLAAKQFIDPVCHHLNGQRPRPGVFLNPTDSQFTTVIGQIRQKFRKERLNWFLIEPGSNGKSYRLGVPPRNLWLTYYDISADRQWDVSGA